MSVDLRNCKRGDKLISNHGEVLTYIGKAPEGSYYDHEVAYDKPGLGNGTRTNEGYVFKHNRLPQDHDIEKVIPLEEWYKHKDIYLYEEEE